MSRRTGTLVVAGFLLVALWAIAALIPVPYVVYSPGPVENTIGDVDGEPVIQVTGAETFPTEGRLDLTTVGVTSADADLDLMTALRAWVDPRYAVVPRELVYPEGTTSEQVQQENVQAMERSQETAKVAALREVGETVPESVVVETVVEGGPSDGLLEPGDVIRSVDGTPVTDPARVGEIVRAHSVGEPVTFVVARDGTDRTVEVTTEDNPQSPGNAYVGIGADSGYEFPFDVEIALGEDIGGPSAGLMFSLGIVDVLTPGAMTGGEHFAGTGTIDADAVVGPIGGIQQKITAAEDEGAALFLAPEGNCDEARGARNGDMAVVSVRTLDDALAAVAQAADGDLSGLPRCE